MFNTLLMIETHLYGHSNVSKNLSNVPTNVRNEVDIGSHIWQNTPIGRRVRRQKGNEMSAGAKGDFGLTKAEREQVESIVRTVPAEWQAVLRMAIIIGIGEMTPGKPFQDYAKRVMEHYSVEGES